MRTGRQVLGLVGFLAVTFAAAAIGGIFSAQGTSSDWYAALNKPPWQPPGAVFGPVWTVLYTLIAVSAWLVWRKVGFTRAARWPLGLWAVQLVLNVLWSALFFGERLFLAASIEIALLWLAILATIVLFWRISALAGALLLPYLAWVTFASALTFWITANNP